MTEALPEQVFKLNGAAEGPHLAIFAGVHGNEKAGVLALNELKNRLKLKRGIVYLAFANPLAIEKNARFIGKNLNRCFFTGNEGDTYEDQRARELMEILDRCEALLDLHAFKDDIGDPFVICEENALDIATKLEPEIISTNWSEAEPGATDGYMYEKGKIGICVECGPLKQAEAFKPLAIQSVFQFLKYFDVIDSTVEFNTKPKRIIRAEKGVIRKSENFWLDESLQNFQKLKRGQVIGGQGEKYLAREGDYIIFPRPNAAIGAEAFIIGREVIHE